MAHNICGLYYLRNDSGHGNYHRRSYLPQVAVRSHTTIRSTIHTTNLTQTFVNQSDTSQNEATYAFPLYDGVVVTDFTCTIGARRIVGQVQEKQQARETFDIAVARGETAGLLESLPAGVFSVSIGNIPARCNVNIDLIYAGELKHDAQIDGIRFILPLSIAPRYGSYPGESVTLDKSMAEKRGMDISVDFDFAPLSIRTVSTPSRKYEPFLQKQLNPEAPSSGTARLALTSAEMEEDFILLIEVDDIVRPQAIMQISSMHDSQAIMATFVPKFRLPNISPEIVFIIDQSGSMMGAKNLALVRALRVFLKSLPIGVHFNICPFGATHEFAFEKSVAYTKESAAKALTLTQGLNAQYGGTLLQAPVEDTFRRRLADKSLEIIILTDGEIWNETSLFGFINSQLEGQKVEARVFCLGIGDDVSHTLVEGVARAGRGLAQFATPSENLEVKVVRMLKASLCPHFKNVRMSIDNNQIDEDFVVVASPSEDVDPFASAPLQQMPQLTMAIPSTSLFDEAADLDMEIPGSAASSAENPIKMPVPKAFQAPHDSISIFPFSRTTIYHIQPRTTSIPTTVTVTAEYGPIDSTTSKPSPLKNLKIQIPIQTMINDRNTSHPILALAARKAIHELEEGRGWLSSYVPIGLDKPMKDDVTWSAEYDKLVELHCVELGVKYQVPGKFTSYVAVEEGGDQLVESRQDVPKSKQVDMQALQHSSISKKKRSGTSYMPIGMHGTPLLPAYAVTPGQSRRALAFVASPMPGSSHGQPQYAAPQAIPPPSNAIFGYRACATPSFASPSSALRIGQPLQATSPLAPHPSGLPFDGGSNALPNAVSSYITSQFGQPLQTAPSPAPPASVPLSEPEISNTAPAEHKTDIERLRGIIDEQTFDGHWTGINQTMISLLGLDAPQTSTVQDLDEVKTTILVLEVLECRFEGLREVWELCADKAEAWLSMRMAEARREQDRVAMRRLLGVGLA